MKIIPELSKGFEYTRLPYDEYVATFDGLLSKGWTREDLGFCSDGTHKIFGYKYGNIEDKPVIFLQGALHGSEWNSCYWLREFKEYLSGKPSAHNENFNRIRS